MEERVRFFDIQGTAGLCMPALLVRVLQQQSYVVVVDSTSEELRDRMGIEAIGRCI